MENLEKEILFLIEEYKKNQFTQSYEEYLQNQELLQKINKKAKQYKELIIEKQNGKRYFKILNKYIIEATSLDNAEKYIVTNYPNEYFGATIEEVQKDGKRIFNCDFALIPKYDFELYKKSKEEVFKMILAS